MTRSNRGKRPRRTAVVALLIMLALATGCASTTTATPASAPAGESTYDPAVISPVVDAPPSPQLPVTVDSADGRSVEVTDVSRIIAVNLSGSLAEIVFTLGLGDNVVGRDISTTFDAAEHLPVVTNAHDLSAEGILELDPTVVLVDDSIGPEQVLDQLRATGIPVVVVPEAWSIEEAYPRMAAVAAALGVPDIGAKLIERTKAEIADALETAPEGESPTIAFLYVRGTAGVYLMAGDGAGPDDLIEAIGGVDAGTAVGLEKFRPITSEGLVSAAPDVLLLMEDGLESVGGVDGLVDIPGIAQTPAAQNRRVVAMDDGSLLSFGPRTGQVVRELARRVYAGAEE
jgi:iron complex transport system substrate-binding protein